MRVSLGLGNQFSGIAIALLATLILSPLQLFANSQSKYVYEAGHTSLQEWVLPQQVPSPADNKTNAAKITLGKTLFFDVRLSGFGDMSCASCHNPLLGWADALPKAQGRLGKILRRATPSIINSGYNGLQMWDGRMLSLEEQVFGPMQASDEMNTNMPKLLDWLNQNEAYRRLFAEAFPEVAIDANTIAKAIAAFERSVVESNTAFDRWIKGDERALNEKEVSGFKLFVAEDKGNCVICHSPPNFTDDGFHNIGLESYADENPDMGRYAIRPINILKGAFKTPALRAVASTAPYFHDGSAKTLREVVVHYNKGGELKKDLSPNIRELKLTNQEIDDIVAFLNALSSQTKTIALPVLPD